MRSPVKRQLQSGIQPQFEEYKYQNELSTIGMRIRQSVGNGYKIHAQEPQNYSVDYRGYSNNCIQDNSSTTIPEYKRVPMPTSRQTPMLVNQRTISSSSALEMWEDKLDQRLTSIDNDIMKNKLGASDFMSNIGLSGTKRNFEDFKEW